MTKSALIGRADDPRACRGVIRAALLTLPLVVFVSLALLPLSANLDNSGKVSVQRCEAYADVTPTEYGYQFLEAVAGEAGLSVDDTVATVTGVTASATGLVIANSTGIVFGASGNRALNNLAEAADYPSWDTLTAEQQQAWVDEDNYDAAKFNALLDAYGLGEDRDTFYSSGGHNFEFSQESIDNIQRLGRIGGLWANNIGCSIEDIRSAIKNASSVRGWFPAASDSMVFDATGIDNWPNAYPRQINYTVNPTEVYCVYSATNKMSYHSFSSPVHSYIFVSYDSGNDNYTIAFSFFSKETFTFNGGSVALTKAPIQAFRANWNGNTFYYRNLSIVTNNIPGQSSPTANVYPGLWGFNNDIMGNILFGNGTTTTGSSAPEVPEYPEDIEDNVIVYYPTEGINPDVQWPDYTQMQRPDNPYNPDDQTGKSDWEQETKQNVIPLQNIRFDKLFPFCLMTDVKDLTEKIEETITPGEQSDYLKIRITMAYASDGEGGYSSEEIELDGTPLRDLLVMVKPFNQILLLFLMVFSLVMFWKSILTGD